VSDLVNDQGPNSAGTTIGAGILDALVVAQPHVYNYTIPATSATLAQTFPLIECVFSPGDNTGAKVVIASATLSLTASSENYIDVTSAGAYVLAGSVAINASAPAVGAGNVRMFRATTGVSSVTTVTLLAPVQPLNVTQVQNAVQLSPASQQAGSINVSGAIATASSVSAASVATTGALTGVSATVTDVTANGHFRHGATTPTFVASVNVASGSMAYGDDKAGVISVTTSPTASAGLVGTLYWGTPYVNPPVMIVMPRTLAANPTPAPAPRTNGESTTGVQIIFGGTPAASTTYLVQYIVVE